MSKKLDNNDSKKFNLPTYRVDLSEISDYLPVQIRQIFKENLKAAGDIVTEERGKVSNVILNKDNLKRFVDNCLKNIEQDIFPDEKINNLILKDIFPESSFEDLDLNEKYYRKIIEDLFDTLPEMKKGEKNKFPDILRVENHGSEKYSLRDFIRIAAIPLDNIPDEDLKKQISGLQVSIRFIIATIQSRYLLDNLLEEYEEPVKKFYLEFDNILNGLAANDIKKVGYSSYTHNNERINFRKRLNQENETNTRNVFSGPFLFKTIKYPNNSDNKKATKDKNGEKFKDPYLSPFFSINSIYIRSKNVVKLHTNTIGDPEVYNELVKENKTKGDVIGIKLLTSSIMDTYNCLNTIIPELQKKYKIPENQRKTTLIDKNDAGLEQFDQRMKRLIELENYLQEIGLKTELENIKRNQESNHFKNFGGYEDATNKFYKTLHNVINEYLETKDEEKYQRSKEELMSISNQLKEERLSFIEKSENELESSILEIRKNHIIDNDHPGMPIVKNNGELHGDATQVFRKIYDILGGKGEITYGKKDTNRHSGGFYLSINYKVEIAPNKFIELVVIPEYLDVLLEAAEPHKEYDNKKMNVISKELRNIMPIFKSLNQTNS